MARKLKYPLLAAILLVAPAAPAVAGHKAALKEGSRLWFEGTSTLHDYECEVKRVELDMELNFTGVGAFFESLTTGGARVSIPVDSIESGKKLMDSKLRDALEAKTHPRITFEILTARAPSLSRKEGLLVLIGSLKVAGVEKRMEFPVQVHPRGDGEFRVSGRVSVNMSDFGIDPPTMMLGTVKTGDAVTIHLDLVTGPAES